MVRPRRMLSRAQLSYCELASANMATGGQVSGTLQDNEAILRRADEAEELLTAVKKSVVEFIRVADHDTICHALRQNGNHDIESTDRPVILNHHPPKELEGLLSIPLPHEPRGKSGLLQAVDEVLRYSVNTWSQGFLDKLYASTTPAGLAADMLLSALNTNVHVYQVSPVLTVVEKQTSRALAQLFGLKGPYAGGVSQPGGSAANLSSIVIARNNLHPETKTEGYAGKKLVLFTSADGHYSLEKAAQIMGFGSNAVRSVPVDDQGRMLSTQLDAAISAAKQAGQTPFYVNATAGTTVLGSFDPLDEIAEICQKHKLWMHVDGSWGGPVVFSPTHRHKLRGVERADSVALCPHKMLGVPLTCSFLLGKDLREFHKGMTLPAGYLFHSAVSDQNETEAALKDTSTPNGHEELDSEARYREVHDLADLTPQCGRRGDALKLALTWLYQGTVGFTAYVDSAFATAAHLASLLQANQKFTLVSNNPPPCLQVCFYFRASENRKENGRITEQITKRLVRRGFMTDYAPGPKGLCFRVVINGQTKAQTVEGLVRAVEEEGSVVVGQAGI
nr:l-aspartate decarboxylase dtxs4 [Quercus suber]